ncbi:pectate lyase [Hymenobacter aerilatus]|uniref:Pectate lyase n=1 Tax=Hymenobacter aerilatus TaxID=2932251 RepID=A0A8T9T3G8_9BACT|nr:pectate lyase [Hymenobacter aerilatus]UOR06656.1 pectate lyase [Hymenobacter aerilatus]
MTRFFTVLLLLVTGVIGGRNSFANAPTVRVAQDGSGDFRTIQAALNSLSAHADQQRVVYIKNGTYPEKVYLDGKDHVTLLGQSEKGVVITISQARDAARCEGNLDDWGVATLNLRNAPNVTLEKLTVVNSYGFNAAGDVTINCPADASGQKIIGKTGHQMALRTFPGTTRLVVKNCTFRALGGDTVSPWDVEAGLYYFKDCTLEGGVDFYCPRGWAYAENCRFICHNMSAAIWHDGSANKDSKTVLVNCRFEGDDNFKLGRFHREAQFYLLSCRFPKNMADADIYWAESGPGAKQWGRRVYYANARRRGGNYAWMADNLASAEGSPTVKQITPNWTFGGRWNVDPKAPALPAPPVVAVEKDSMAERMLLYQRSVGGWPKAVGEVKVKYDHPMTAAQKAATLDDKGRNDATIDNNATSREIRYLVEAAKRTGNLAYRRAAENGIRYLLKMQYANGGFPQFYPDHSNYRHQITYNDNAMIQAMQVLRDLAEQRGNYTLLDQGLVEPARKAVARGIDCILKTQYVQHGQLTAWAAQYDEKTLQPAKARAFELASLSGDETVAIVEFLMDIKNPSPEIKKSIEAAVAWLDKVKLEGYAMRDVTDPKQPSGRDRLIVPEAGSTIWARFYELNTNRPIYVGRDSKVHYSLAEIENERRVGYSYVGTWPAKLLNREYPKWKKQQGT